MSRGGLLGKGLGKTQRSEDIEDSACLGAFQEWFEGLGGQGSMCAGSCC